MEDAPEPEPRDEPVRPDARQTGVTRGPQRARTQSGRTPPIARSTAKPAPKQTPKQTPKTAAKAGTRQAAKPAVKPAVQPVTRQAAKPAAKVAQRSPQRAALQPGAPSPAEPAVEPEAVVEQAELAEPVEPPVPAEPALAEPVEPPVPVEPLVSAEPAEKPAPTRPAIPRLTVPRLTLPKLTLPRLTAPKGQPPEATKPEEVEAADTEAVSTQAESPPAPAGRTVELAPKLAPKVAPTVAPEVTSQIAPPVAPEIEVAVQETREVAIAEAAKPAPAGRTVARKSRRTTEVVLHVEGLTKTFDDKVAVDHLDLAVRVGSFYGIVGPNGAGKTTTLSMITGLMRPDAGSVEVHGADVWSDPVVAKRNMGVLPDRLRLFDRLTGAQVLYYAGVLRGLDSPTVRARTADLAAAFGLEDSLGRLVTDYSAGMTKKIALAAAMIHSPRLLVLDEPFESVDPVSAATVTQILKNYVKAGGTVLLSSHSMDLVQRICDYVAVVVNGVVLADGTMASVRDGRTLEERFVELAGGRTTVEGLEWLHRFSD